MKKFIQTICVLFVLILTLPFAACNSDSQKNHQEENDKVESVTHPSNGSEENNDVDDGKVENGNDDDGFMTDDGGCELFDNTIERLYSYGEDASLVFLKIVSVSADLYRVNAGDEYFWMYECVVVEDVYGHLEAGTAIYVPVSMFAIDADAFSEVKDLFVKDTIVLAHFWQRWDDVAFMNRLPSCDRCFFNPCASRCGLAVYEFVPFKNNKVALNDLNAWLDKNMSEKGLSYKDYENYTDYIEDGMTLDEVTENLRAFALAQKEN